MGRVILIGGPFRGRAYETPDNCETVVIQKVLTNCKHNPAYGVAMIEYKHFRDNLFKVEDDFDIIDQLCFDCVMEAKARVFTRALGDKQYTRKYRKEMKRFSDGLDAYRGN